LPILVIVIAALVVVILGGLALEDDISGSRKKLESQIGELSRKLDTILREIKAEGRRS